MVGQDAEQDPETFFPTQSRYTVVLVKRSSQGAWDEPFDLKRRRRKNSRWPRRENQNAMMHLTKKFGLPRPMAEMLEMRTQASDVVVALCGRRGGVAKLEKELTTKIWGPG